MFQAIWTHKDVKLSDVDVNHESIHAKQELECGVVFFLLAYAVCWIIAGFSYRGNAMEQEAYANEADMEYLKNRKHYAWFKYIGKRPRR